MPIGQERDNAQKRAVKLEAAINMEGYLRSNEFKPPEYIVNVEPTDRNFVVVFLLVANRR